MPNEKRMLGGFSLSILGCGDPWVRASCCIFLEFLGRFLLVAGNFEWSVSRTVVVGISRLNSRG